MNNEEELTQAYEGIRIAKDLLQVIMEEEPANRAQSTKAKILYYDLSASCLKAKEELGFVPDRVTKATMKANREMYNAVQIRLAHKARMQEAKTALQEAKQALNNILDKEKANA